MKKLSVYFLFGVAVFAAYLAVDLQFAYRLWTSEYQQVFAQNVDHLEDEAYLASAYLKATDSTDRLFELLDHRVQARTVDFWAVYHRGTLYRSDLKPVEIEALDIQPSELAESDVLYTLDGVNHAYFVYDLGNNFELIVGKRYNLNDFLWREAGIRINVVYKDILLSCLLALAAFAFYFRDIMASIRFLTNKNLSGRDFSRIRTHSKEADVVVKGFAAYEDQSTRLKVERDLLSWQVLPSLRTELMSGRTPPYEFTCTLVRTDINHFSKIFNEHPIQPFTSLINDFFTDVTHVVSRYQGLVHEFIGDEVIYYFKDEDVGNSVRAAVSAIRDINEIAERYDRLARAERGYAFTIKTSLARGSIQFRRFVNGFNLAGAVLIETVRILSFVTDREQNSVIFDKRHLSELGDLVNTKYYGTAHLKGYQGEHELYSYEGHKSIGQLLSDLDVENLVHYRSDADITETLRWLAGQVQSERYAEAMKVIAVLRLCEVTPNSRAVDVGLSILLGDWLEGLLNKALRDGSRSGNPEKHDQLFAAALRLIENLAPRPLFDERLESICKRAARCKHKRVIANALDVLTRMRSEEEPEFAKTLLNHEDNRVVANALVHEGTRGVSTAVLKKIRKMLTIDDARYVASALYAIGEIASFHRSRDPVYYQTQIGLLTMAEALPNYARSPDPMIRKQALMGLEKIGDMHLIARIKQLASTSDDDELQKAVDQIFGESKDAPTQDANSAGQPVRKSA